MAIQDRYAPAANTEGCTRLRAVWNFQHVFTFERWNRDLISQSGLRVGNRNYTVQIIALALKERVFLDVKHDVEVAGRAPVAAAFTESGETYAGSVFDACRDFSVDRSLLQDSPFALALRTRVGNHAARPLACGASASDAEKALLITNLPLTGAGTAGYRGFAGSGARAPTLCAGLVMTNRDFSFSAEYCLFKFQIDVFAEISTSLGTRTLAGAAASEDVSDPEDVSEDITEVLEPSAAETSTCRPVPTDPGMAESIVQGTFFTVAEDGVGFARLLELLLRVGIVGIAVRMELQGKSAISALNLLVGRFPGDAKNFIVVAFYVASQNNLPKISL
jgi:hypothetical protein